MLMCSKRVVDRPSRKLATVALMLTLLWAVGAHADDLGTPTIVFSGFGTLGAVHSTEDKADYTSSPFTKPSGAGYTRNWSGDVDSRLGAQLDRKSTRLN